MRLVNAMARGGLMLASLLVLLGALSGEASAGTPITWTVTLHDNVVNVAGFGDVVETQTIRRTALHTDANAVTIVTKVRTDGAGRVIESVDAENQITSATYDAGGNRLTIRDPNNVGQDCTFDARNRDISCTDTQGDTTQTGYNAANQVAVAQD